MINRHSPRSSRPETGFECSGDIVPPQRNCCVAIILAGRARRVRNAQGRGMAAINTPGTGGGFARSWLWPGLRARLPRLFQRPPRDLRQTRRPSDQSGAPRRRRARRLHLGRARPAVGGGRLPPRRHQRRLGRRAERRRNGLGICQEWPRRRARGAGAVLGGGREIGLGGAMGRAVSVDQERPRTAWQSADRDRSRRPSM